MRTGGVALPRRSVTAAAPRTQGLFDGPGANRPAAPFPTIRPRSPAARRPSPPTPSALRVSAFAHAAVGLALLAVSACQDPSTVGTGLIDEDVSDPALRILPAIGADTSLYTLVTSGLADLGNPTQSRVLVGRAQDALYGDAEAVAYLDASAPGSLPSGFGDRPITRVTLELRRDYTFGDTTASFPVELRQITGSWSPDGIPADTTLGTGDLLTTATVAATDTTTVFTLPDAWVAANDSLFTSASFSSAFEGFELRAALGAAAVAGFNVSALASTRPAESRIRVATARDTVTFRLSEVYTRLTRGPAGFVPGRRLLRAGAGEGATFLFDYAGVLRLPLAQAVFRLPVDRALAGATGTFLRPLAREAALFVRRETGAPLFVALVRTFDTGDARTTVNTGLTALVQSILLDQDSDFLEYEIRFPATPVSLDVLPLTLDGTTDTTRPRLSLTVVGQPT